MIKYILLFLVSISVANTAICKTVDTAIMYLKYQNGIGVAVPSLASADYFMLILPPDSGDTRYNIQQFYKNGKIKFIGKSESDANSIKTGIFSLDGDCVSYYENGKKSSIAHYNKGYKDGLEYLFYPNGVTFCCLKHILGKTVLNDITLNWECYDTDGNVICKEGNGQWILYDDDYKNKKMEGRIINGHMEGEWHGSINNPDTVKYVSNYKNGIVLSSTGYDKHGNVYPFKNDFEPASYRSGQVTFLEILRGHINIPRDANGRKVSIDTIHVSFVVEKDGHLDKFSTLGEVDSKLKDAIFAGLAKCNGWNPERFFGVPFRAQVIFPLSEEKGFTSFSYQKKLEYQIKVLKDN